MLHVVVPGNSQLQLNCSRRHRVSLLPKGAPDNDGDEVSCLVGEGDMFVVALYRGIACRPLCLDRGIETMFSGRAYPFKDVIMRAKANRRRGYYSSFMHMGSTA